MATTTKDAYTRAIYKKHTYIIKGTMKPVRTAHVR